MWMIFFGPMRKVRCRLGIGRAHGMARTLFLLKGTLMDETGYRRDGSRTLLGSRKSTAACRANWRWWSNAIESRFWPQVEDAEE